MGTSARNSRTARRIRSATSGLANVITTQLACAKPDVFQHLDLAGIAVDDRIAGLPADANPVSIQIERDVLEACLLEHPRNVLPDPPEAANDHVIAFGDGQSRPGLRASLPVRRPGFASRARVMRRLCRISTGDNTMLSTVAASSGCTTAGSSNSRRSNRVSSAKPNSPPWPTTTPVRKDLNQLLVAGSAATVDDRTS